MAVTGSRDFVIPPHMEPAVDVRPRDSHLPSFNHTTAWLIGLCGVAVGAVVILCNVRVHTSSHKNSEAETGIMNMVNAISMYEILYRAFPDSLDLLCIDNAEQVAPLTRAMLEAMREDPWGKPYRYQLTSATTFEIRSSGPDLLMGTADDLTN